jgi:riboflavin-specific deaminase-like protein
LPEHPAKITISKKCDISAESNFFTTEGGEKYVFTTEEATRQNVARIKKNARVFRVGKKRVAIKKMLAILFAHGVRKLMVEGGGRTNYEFLKTGVVDEMRIAIAPIIIGKTDAPVLAYGNDYLSSLPFSLKSVEQLGDMVILRYVLSGI